MWPFGKKRAPDVKLTADPPEDIPDSLGFTGEDIRVFREQIFVRAQQAGKETRPQNELPCTCRPKYQPPTFIDPNCYHHREVGA